MVLRLHAGAIRRVPIRRGSRRPRRKPIRLGGPLRQRRLLHRNRPELPDRSCDTRELQMETPLCGLWFGNRRGGPAWSGFRAGRRGPSPEDRCLGRILEVGTVRSPRRLACRRRFRSSSILALQIRVAMGRGWLASCLQSNPGMGTAFGPAAGPQGPFGRNRGVVLSGNRFALDRARRHDDPAGHSLVARQPIPLRCAPRRIPDTFVVLAGLGRPAQTARSRYRPRSFLANLGALLVRRRPFEFSDRRIELRCGGAHGKRQSSPSFRRDIRILQSSRFRNHAIVNRFHHRIRTDSVYNRLDEIRRDGPGVIRRLDRPRKHRGIGHPPSPGARSVGRLGVDSTTVGDLVQLRPNPLGDHHAGNRRSMARPRWPIRPSLAGRRTLLGRPHLVHPDGAADRAAGLHERQDRLRPLRRNQGLR